MKLGVALSDQLLLYPGNLFILLIHFWQYNLTVYPLKNGEY